MSDWLREIENELERAERSPHPGRTRTAARRIAGIAIQQLPKLDPGLMVGGDYLAALRSFLNSPDRPQDVRDAAARLEARLAPDFTSPSIDPIADAMIVVGFVKAMLAKNSGGKNESPHKQ